MGHPGRRQSAGRGPSRRHRRPVRRHPGRSRRAADPGGVGGIRCSVGISRHRRHRATARLGGGRAGPPFRGHRADRGGRAAGDRQQGTHRLAADPAGPGPGRCRGGAGAGLSDVRRRRPAGRSADPARGFADPAGPAGPGVGVPELAEQSDRARAGRRPPAQGGPMGRDRDVIVASDECYLGLGWDAEPLSVLHPRSATKTIPGCSRSTRCRRARRWPGTGPASSPGIRPWSPSCWPCASTPG